MSLINNRLRYEGITSVPVEPKLSELTKLKQELLKLAAQSQNPKHAQYGKSIEVSSDIQAAFGIVRFQGGTKQSVLENVLKSVSELKNYSAQKNSKDYHATDASLRNYAGKNGIALDTNFFDNLKKELPVENLKPVKALRPAYVETQRGDSRILVQMNYKIDCWLKAAEDALDPRLDPSYPNPKLSQEKLQKAADEIKNATAIIARDRKVDPSKVTIGFSIAQQARINRIEAAIKKLNPQQ